MSGKSGCEYIKCEYVRRDTGGVRCTHPGGICIYRDEADTIARLKAENASLREEVADLRAQNRDLRRDLDDWAISVFAQKNKALRARAEQAEKRLAFRGKVTSGVFCDGCADWEQMAWQAGIDKEAAEWKVEKAREAMKSSSSTYSVFDKLRQILK